MRSVLRQHWPLMLGSAALSLGLSGLGNGLFQIGGQIQPLWASLAALALIGLGIWPWALWWRAEQTRRGARERAGKLAFASQTLRREAGAKGIVVPPDLADEIAEAIVQAVELHPRQH